MRGVPGLQNQNTLFVDRQEAGEVLAKALKEIELHPPVIVLGLSRGGVPVASKVARLLETRLEVMITRKLSVPGNKEFGFGAIAENDTLVIDSDLLETLEISPLYVTQVIEKEQAELIRQVATYRRSKSLASFKSATVIVVDDGLATGISGRAACMAVRKDEPQALLYASPVCAPTSASMLESVADTIICLHQPKNFSSVGQFYTHFPQVSDDEVISLLKQRGLDSKR